MENEKEKTSETSSVTELVPDATRELCSALENAKQEISELNLTPSTKAWLSKILEPLNPEDQLAVARLAERLNLERGDSSFVLFVTLAHCSGFLGKIEARLDETTRERVDALAALAARLEAANSRAAETRREEDVRLPNLVERLSEELFGEEGKAKRLTSALDAALEETERKASATLDAFRRADESYESLAEKHAKNLQAVVSSAVVQRIGENFAEHLGNVLNETDRRAQQFFSKAEDDRVASVSKLEIATERTIDKLRPAVEKAVIEGARSYESERRSGDPRAKALFASIAAAVVLSISAVGLLGYHAGVDAGETTARAETLRLGSLGVVFDGANWKSSADGRLFCSTRATPGTPLFETYERNCAAIGVDLTRSKRT